MQKLISVLGSTGSIGTQTLDVVREFKNSLKVVGLAAGKNIDLLASQIKEFSPKIVSVADSDSAKLLQKQFKNVKILFGEEGNNSVAGFKSAQCVVIATPGLAGINPTLTAIKAHKTIALATKEVLVSAGSIVTKEAKRNNVKILPVDSEHSAIFQCLEGRDTKEIKTIYLTCSGGPFRGYTKKQFKTVDISQALNHPRWKMGKKISTDSATLMNKGFEVIEAMWLFDVPLEKIHVIVHPQSAIHSAVEFVDNTIIAQIGPADMRLPIQYALLYSQKRQINNFKRFSFTDCSNLTFEEPDVKTFKCLKLAYLAAKKGGTMPVVLTAANDVAVEAFLQGKLPFYKIPLVVEKVLSAHKNMIKPSFDDILSADQWARDESLIRSRR